MKSNNVPKLFLALLTLAAVALFAAKEVAANSDAFNSAGNHVFASAEISDNGGAGVVTTVATSGTFVTVGTAAPLVAGTTANGGLDLSGGITYALATNKFTIASRAGTGAVHLSACLGDVIGVNAKTRKGAWHRVRAGATVVIGFTSQYTEPAAAVRAPQGCIEADDVSQLADTYDFRYDSQTNGDTVTTRAAKFRVEKKTNT